MTHLVLPQYDNSQKTTFVWPAVSGMWYICIYSTELDAAMETWVLSVSPDLLWCTGTYSKVWASLGQNEKINE